MRHNVTHPMNFKKIQFSICNFKVFFNILAPDYLVFGQNLSHHSFFVCATDATQSFAPIYRFNSKDTFINSIKNLILKKLV